MFLLSKTKKSNAPVQIWCFMGFYFISNKNSRTDLCDYVRFYLTIALSLISFLIWIRIISITDKENFECTNTNLTLYGCLFQYRSNKDSRADLCNHLMIIIFDHCFKSIYNNISRPKREKKVISLKLIGLCLSSERKRL